MNKHEWQSLKKGDIIYSIKSGITREVISDGAHGCIRLKAVHKTKFDNDWTVYTNTEAKNFSKTPITKQVKASCLDSVIVDLKHIADNLDIYHQPNDARILRERIIFLEEFNESYKNKLTVLSTLQLTIDEAKNIFNT